MTRDEQVLKLVKAAGLLKRINHKTNTLTIRRAHHFNDEELRIIGQSKYNLRIER